MRDRKHLWLKIIYNWLSVCQLWDQTIKRLKKITYNKKITSDSNKRSKSFDIYNWEEGSKHKIGDKKIIHAFIWEQESFNIYINEGRLKSNTENKILLINNDSLLKMKKV